MPNAMPTATPTATPADTPQMCAACPMYDEYYPNSCGEDCPSNVIYIPQLTADERVTSDKIHSAATLYTEAMGELSSLKCAVNAAYREEVRSCIIVLASYLGLDITLVKRSMFLAEKRDLRLTDIYGTKPV